MLFSLYYGVDLTRGFLSVALALMDATIQDLQRLPEMMMDAPMALPAPESSSAPLDPSVLQPFIASLDDGVSAVICCVGCRGGTGKVYCNDKFKSTFFSSEDLTYRTLNESTLPIYVYACIVAPEDRAEFVDSLTNVCFGTQTALPQVTHIVKVRPSGRSVSRARQAGRRSVWLVGCLVRSSNHPIHPIRRSWTSTATTFSPSSASAASRSTTGTTARTS